MRFGKHLKLALVGMLACGACTGVPRSFLVGRQQRATVVTPTFDGRTGFDGTKLLAEGSGDLSRISPAFKKVKADCQLAVEEFKNALSTQYR